MPSFSAVRGLMTMTLSHVTLLSGLGSSCSHGLLAKRPSCTLASALKVTSTASAAGVGGAPQEFVEGGDRRAAGRSEPAGTEGVLPVGLERLEGGGRRVVAKSRED